MIEAVKSCMSRYAQFEGRASRSEFWFFVLFLAIVQTFLANVVNWASGEFSISWKLYLGIGTEESWTTNFFTLVFIVPLLAVLSRRFQDAGFQINRLVLLGLLLFSTLVFVVKPWPAFPYVQHLILALALAFFGFLIFVTTKRSQPGSTRYGPNPLEVTP